MIIEAVRERVFSECNNGKNAFGQAFFDQHLLVVREYGGLLAKALGADAEIVELATYLHDIAAVQDITALPRHAVLSAEVARQVLQDHGYPGGRIERVARCILSHAAPVRIEKGLPEEVCLSNADAMSQVARPLYWLYYVFRVRQSGFAEGREWLRQRVENNWAALIPPARAIIEKQYRQAKELLSS